jgi:Raf kinase inhibitor-like YbhB/YbcL family protein
MNVRLLAVPLMSCALIACSDDPAETSSNTTSTSGSGGSGASGGMGATGGGDVGGAGGSTGCADGAALELTSPVVAEMGLLPAEYKCMGFAGGQNISPPLAWTSGPVETMSYAIMFRDITGATFLHSAIWDIPACSFALEEDVDKSANPSDVPGAKQCRAYNAQFGYAGPCAPGDPNPRQYQFEIYAIGAASLPGVTTDSSLSEVQAAMDANSLSSDLLTVIEDG